MGVLHLFFFIAIPFQSYTSNSEMSDEVRNEESLKLKLHVQAITRRENGLYCVLRKRRRHVCRQLWV